MRRTDAELQQTISELQTACVSHHHRRLNLENQVKKLEGVIRKNGEIINEKNQHIKEMSLSLDQERSRSDGLEIKTRELATLVNEKRRVIFILSGLIAITSIIIILK